MLLAAVVSSSSSSLTANGRHQQSVGTTCPDDSVIDPCTCADTNDAIGVTLDCTALDLDDDTVARILATFDGSSSTITRLLLANNALTRVPHQIGTFQHLNYVQLDDNKIDSIPTEAFNFSGGGGTSLPAGGGGGGLFLRRNQLQTIAPGAFQGLY